MGQHVLAGNPPIEVTLRRSARARRISLRVSSLDGRVTLTMPRGLPERDGLDFARSKHDWLARQLTRQVSEVPVRIGAEVPVKGQPMTLVAGTGRRVVTDGDRLLVPGSADSAGARVQAWLKTLARERLVEASDRYAAALGRPYARITLRDTRSRWGSCTADAGLMYSWRLILAPPEVLDYVAAHEVAHLQEMNHSPAFWALVAQLLPGYDAPRKWLRVNGSSLHRYRF
ncbi:M48 family metallopeptidase [Roseovarius pelagicus]|uniref:M48 family metallopeptidase n=1 Tax=Roseovarius pelagicus TaxID=2980108 RepID=A0ABY6D7K8_9RHOB|nr:SprT family zinc-dependent metalloprotease [Roseovarius pelagicus]UXX82122.1 M48 family metallopeptidase [Roseovarius pelagicus]